jgi:hypothetical protein
MAVCTHRAACVAFAMFIAAIWNCPVGFADENQPSAADDGPLATIDRRITKQPQYAGKPGYALLALGEQAPSPVWMVLDGQSIYVDQNANGDLTDDGGPLLPEKMQKLGKLPGGTSDRWQCQYNLDKIATPDGRKHSAFSLHRWNYEDPEDQFGLSLKLNGKIPMYAGWFVSIWNPKPENASVIHFGGALKPNMLRYREFVVDSGVRRLSLSFTNPGRGTGATSRLSMYALPESVIPRVRIEWPVAKGAAPLETTYLLKERCCYWEFYDSKFKIPAAAVEGTATITVDLPDGEFPLALSTNQIKVPVLLTASPEFEKD